MALFKISKGQSSVLDQQALNEGYAWFTPDNGKFYIDAYVRKEVDGVEKDVLTRIPLCADIAERDGEGRNIVDTYSNFYITAVKQNDTISVDKTHDEIIQAYNNGSNIILAYRDDDAGEKVKFLPLYSWLNDGNDFSFTGAYNLVITQTNSLSTEVLTITYNSTSGWKKLIDQMVTSVDGETGKVTTNAVKFIEQNLTTSEKAQAKTNIEAAGVASDLITTKPQANVVPKFGGSTDYPTLTKTNVYIKDDKLGVGVANPQSALDVAGVATVGGLTITDEPGTQSNAPTDNSHLTNKKYVDEQDENLRNKLVQGTEDNYKLPYIEKENGSGTGITSLENAAISGSLVVKGAAEDDGLGIQGPSANEDYYKILTNNDKNLYVDATKIGIGTTSPTTKVHVVGETTVDGAVNINDGNVTITGGQVVQSNAPTDNSHLTNKKYVDDSFRANDAMLFKGVINSASDLPVEHYTGWTYKVGTKGSYLGQWCEVGDTIYCVSDSAASATAQVNADWQILENNNENVVVRGNGASVGSVGSETQPVYVDANGVVQTTKDFNDYLPLKGGTMSGDLQVGSGAVIQTNGYITGTWLKTTADTHSTNAATKIAILDSVGQICHRTAAEIVSDLGLKLTVTDDGNGNVSLSMGGK